MHRDFELEADLEDLIAAFAESDLESEAEWEAVGAPTCPSPTRVTVSSFPRYAENIGSLPLTEQQRVRQIAGLILNSYRPGCSPVLQVDLVGHADRDFQRGPAFEHQISVRRALALQRTLQQLLNNPPISSRIVWQARGVGARRLVVRSPGTERERASNRRVDVVLSLHISASYPVLVKHPAFGYTWTMRSAAPAMPAAGAAEHELLTFPDPLPVSDSLQVPFKWICSLLVDFGPEPGPIVTGNRIGARGTGTLISGRHVLTAGHALLSQGPEKKDILGNPLDSTLPALSVTVIPGRDGGKVPAVEPQGRVSATKTRVSPAWKQSNATNRAFDYGLITLDQPLPASYGFWSSGKSRILPAADSVLKGQAAHCSGYPAFCPPPNPAGTVPCDRTTRGSVQFLMSGNVTDTSPELMETQMKIAEGHSGSPTWLLASTGAMNLVGIASASRAQAPEIAVRIRSSMLQKLRGWMLEDGVTASF